MGNYLSRVDLEAFGMHPRLFRLLNPPESVAKLGCWAAVTGRFSLVAGYTAFGSFFLRDPATGQYAVLLPIPPELVPTDFSDPGEFTSAFLTNPGIVQQLGRPADVASLEWRFGPLSPSEVYFPVPYPFFGGSDKLDTYDKGDTWVFADLV